MAWHWIGLALFSLTLLPAGLAMITGRTPEHLRTWLTSTRTSGWPVLALYAVASLNAIPRLAGASPATTLAATATAGTVAVTGCAVAAIAALRTANAAS
ncbi:hypothetical protein AB0P07_14915 [Streptomyces sp. NPDC085944]|uniref:hypothetical protein n=1 Tax=Streptomyces sp. NPDC085944 TaxID=3154962 RepID=UPI00342D8E61